ncbi:hypothetical protein CsSME_00022620 [Camellia sinensis var. sinensis]
MAANVENPNVTTLRLIVVYLVIGFTSTLILYFRSLSIVALGTQSSKSLFSQLLNSLFRVPMSFYDSTPLGRILSWVSADLSIVDPDVPFSFVYSFSSTINTYANLAVLAVVTWQVLFISIPMIYLAILLQKEKKKIHLFVLHSLPPATTHHSSPPPATPTSSHRHQ